MSRSAGVAIRGSRDLGKSRFGEVAVCGSPHLWELLGVGVEMCGKRGVWVLRFVGVKARVNRGMIELVLHPSTVTDFVMSHIFLITISEFLAFFASR